jgi:hypothetical protein
MAVAVGGYENRMGGTLTPEAWLRVPGSIARLGTSTRGYRPVFGVLGVPGYQDALTTHRHPNRLRPSRRARRPRHAASVALRRTGKRATATADSPGVSHGEGQFDTLGCYCTVDVCLAC